MSRYSKSKERLIGGFSVHNIDNTKRHISDIQYQLKKESNNSDIKKAIEEQRSTISKKYTGAFEIEKKDSSQLGFGIYTETDMMIKNNRISKDEYEGRMERKRLLNEGLDILKGSGLKVKGKPIDF